MKKFIIAAASAVAVLGLAACSDADQTTTQGVPPQDTQPQQEPMMTPPAEQPIAPAPAPAN